jgi:Tfp pilus assembly protein PilF
VTAPTYTVESVSGAKQREALKLVHLANDAIGRGDMSLASQHWRHAWKLAPDDPTVRYCRGVEALYSHRFTESLTYLRWACNSRWYRDEPQAHFHLGCAYRGAGDFRGAARALRHTLALDPQHMGAMIQRGFLLQMHGDHAQAEALFAKAVTLQHKTPSDRNDLATLSAWRGDYSHWSLFENRWRIGLRHQTPALQEILGTHRWNGKPFPGTLMLEAEQGQGDVLMMARYAKLAATMVEKLVLVVQPSLVSLMLRLGFDVYGTDEPLPHFDAHSPMMSLPWLMGTDDLSKVPPPADFGIPRAPVTGHAGLVWAGSNVAALDKDRSAAVRAFAPLLEIPGITWHSLQRGNREDEYTEIGAQLARGDWLETAHEIATLDFVVSIDSAVAHLAGSLGVPTYLFPPTYFEFRHTRPEAMVANGYGADASVWYPNHSLVRRQHTNDWPAAVELLHEKLARGVTPP